MSGDLQRAVNWPRRGFLRLGLVGLSSALAVRAIAQPSDYGLPPARPTMSELSQEERWRRRFPQPVLVSDLVGRMMLDRDQGVLGWIEAVVREPGGALKIAFARRRLLVFRGATVVVPASVTALLGRFVMILDLDFDQIDRLPALPSTGVTPVDPGSRISMALTRH